VSALVRTERLFRRSEAARGYLLISPTLAVLVFALAAPLALLVTYSFWTENGLVLDTHPTVSQYGAVVTRQIYRVLFLRSLAISAVVTLATVALGYPMAYFLAFRVTRGKFIWLLLLSIPFWTSYLLRVFAWKVILGYNGVINSGLLSLGLISQPLTFLLYNAPSVVVTLTHAYAAFAILPIYVSLEKIDRSLLEAATDLGDGPVKRFLRVTFPLSLPGTIAAILMVFIPTVGDYVTPSLVGGTDGMMIGNSIAMMYGRANNQPLGAVISIVMMLVIAVLVGLFLLAIGRRRLLQKA
jgi:spermidine/putrescine transport system permease protein